MRGRTWPVVALIAAVLLVPQIVWAAVGSFSSGSSTPAVTGTNTSSTGKGVYGNASSTSGSTHIGVYGKAGGSGGIGVYGAGSKYGVYSKGNLGIVSGKSLVCSGCVGTSDLNFTPALKNQLLSAVVASDGTLNRGTNVTSSAVTEDGTGTYEVIFNRNVTACTFVGTLGGTTTGVSARGFITTTRRFSSVNGVYVQTRNTSDALTAMSFHLIVIC